MSVEKVSLPYDGWSDNQIITLAIVNRVTSFLSLAGSGYIVWKVLDPKHREEKMKKMYQRIMLCLSIADMIGSFGVFLGGWAMPADSLEVYMIIFVSKRGKCDNL